MNRPKEDEAVSNVAAMQLLPRPEKRSATTSSASSSPPKQHELNPRDGKMKRLPSSFTPSAYSVLIGRGKLCSDAIGTRRLKVIVSRYVEDYKNAVTRIEKSFVVTSIVDIVREACCPNGGAFIKYKGGHWWEVSDYASREKVSAVLRDALHGQYKSSTKAKVAARRQQRGRRTTTHNNEMQEDEDENNETQDEDEVDDDEYLPLAPSLDFQTSIPSFALPLHESIESSSTSSTSSSILEMDRLVDLNGERISIELRRPPTASLPDGGDIINDRPRRPAGLADEETKNSFKLITRNTCTPSLKRHSSPAVLPRTMDFADFFVHEQHEQPKTDRKIIERAKSAPPPSLSSSSSWSRS